MKVINKVSVGVLTILFTLGLTTFVLAATTKVNLGTADGFAVLAGTAVTNVPTSVITGNVGLSPAAGGNYDAGVTTSQVSGSIYAVDSAGPAGSVNNPGLLTTAKNNLTAAYLDAAGRTPTTTFSATDNQLGGKTLTTGVYAFGHATTANLTAASPLILDAQNNPNAVFIFQASSDLVTASGSVVRLVNGAQACNVFWQVTSSATLGTTSTFKGTLMALTSITVTTGVNIQGRVLARNGAVTLDSDTINRAVCSSSTPLTNTSGNPINKPNLPWNIIILVLAGISTVSIIYSVSKRKQTL